MKVLPSIAFNEFRGTAKDVTARVVGGRTVLNGRATHSRIKSPKQSARRANFSFITKQFKTLSDVQLKAWAALAEAHREKALTGNGVPLTAHNLFVCLNSNRSLVGVEMTKDAPADIHGSSYISYDDIWITPTNFVITGLSEPESATSRLVVKLAVSERKGTTKSKWGSTVVLNSFEGSDWGDVDMLSAYTSEFNVPIVVGHTYYLEMYWVDENSGYVSQVSRAAVTATDGESLHGQEYVSRATMKASDLVADSTQEFDEFSGEISPGSRMVSFDVSAVQHQQFAAYIRVNYKKSVIEKGWDNINTFMWARGRTDSDYPYRMSCIQYYFASFGSRREGSFASRGGWWVKRFQTFGTYVSLK